MIEEMRERPGKNNSRTDVCPCGTGWNGELTFSLTIFATNSVMSSGIYKDS